MYRLCILLALVVFVSAGTLRKRDDGKKEPGGDIFEKCHGELEEAMEKYKDKFEKHCGFAAMKMLSLCFWNNIDPMKFDPLSALDELLHALKDVKEICHGPLGCDKGGNEPSKRQNSNGQEQNNGDQAGNSTPKPKKQGGRGNGGPSKRQNGGNGGNGGSQGPSGGNGGSQGPTGKPPKPTPTGEGKKKEDEKRENLERFLEGFF